MADASETQLDLDLAGEQGTGASHGPSMGLATGGEVVTMPDDQAGPGLPAPGSVPLLHDQDVPEGNGGQAGPSVEGLSGLRTGDPDDRGDHKGLKRLWGE